jgi:hypothetical protein
MAKDHGGAPRKPSSAITDLFDEHGRVVAQLPLRAGWTVAELVIIFITGFYGYTRPPVDPVAVLLGKRQLYARSTLLIGHLCGRGCSFSGWVDWLWRCKRWSYAISHFASRGVSS